MNNKQKMKMKKKIKQRQQRAEFKPLIQMATDPRVGVPSVNYVNWMEALSRKDGRVFDAIVEYLSFFDTHHYKSLGGLAIKSLTLFFQVVSTTIMCEELVPTPNQSLALVQSSHLFNHLVALTPNESCEGLLKAALMLQKNYAKVLFLQNSRCKFQMNQKDIFDTDPVAASLWYQHYMYGISSPTPLIQSNFHRHLQNMDERWVPPDHRVTGLYFACTYHNPGAVPRVKRIMNKAIKARIPERGWEWNNTPDAGHVAIITNKWHRNHAVYKSASPLVEQLIGKKKLTLIWTGEKMPETAVTSYFDEVLHCYFKPDGQLVIPPTMATNTYGMIYFPDIGMTDESVWLSNCRIAPIQAVGYGHPDTTGEGNEIDYFVGGDVEKGSEASYSETQVLLPGLAQEPAWPTAPLKNNYKDDDVVRVNCVWGPDKYNYTLLTVLQAINQTVDAIRKEKKLEQPPFEFHFFASPGINRYAALPSFTREVHSIVPNAIIHSDQEYYAYMENAEMHDFSLNSFPFGCYNVLIESLYMGLPFLTIVGDRFYNRAGMWLNDQIGMGGNNFESPREVVNQAALLITDPEELKLQRKHLASLDLKEKLFTLKGNHFLEAVEYIQANHPFTDTKIIGA